LSIEVDMENDVTKFKQNLSSLKGKQTCFREYSLIALVDVIDVTMDEREFSIRFLISSGIQTQDEIDIGSSWEHVCIEKNGFSIPYVGSQMLVTEDGIALYIEHSNSLASDQDKRMLFRLILDGKMDQLDDVIQSKRSGS